MGYCFMTMMMLMVGMELGTKRNEIAASPHALNDLKQRMPSPNNGLD